MQVLCKPFALNSNAMLGWKPTTATAGGVGCCLCSMTEDGLQYADLRSLGCQACQEGDQAAQPLWSWRDPLVHAGTANNDPSIKGTGITDRMSDQAEVDL